VEVVVGVEEEDFGAALDMAVEEKGILQWRMATITAITMNSDGLLLVDQSLGPQPLQEAAQRLQQAQIVGVGSLQQEELDGSQGMMLRGPRSAP